MKIYSFPRLLDIYQNARKDFDKIYTNQGNISILDNTCSRKVAKINQSVLYRGVIDNSIAYAVFNKDRTELLFVAFVIKVSSRDLFDSSRKLYSVKTIWKKEDIDLGHAFSSQVLQVIMTDLSADALISDLQHSAAFNRVWYRFLESSMKQNSVYIGISIRAKKPTVIYISQQKDLKAALNLTIGETYQHMKCCSFVLNKVTDIVSILSPNVSVYEYTAKLAKQLFKLTRQDLGLEEIQDLINEYNSQKL